MLSCNKNLFNASFKEKPSDDLLTKLHDDLMSNKKKLEAIDKKITNTADAIMTFAADIGPLIKAMNVNVEDFQNQKTEIELETNLKPMAGWGT